MQNKNLKSLLHDAVPYHIASQSTRLQIHTAAQILTCEQAFGRYFFPQTESLFTGYSDIIINSSSVMEFVKKFNASLREMTLAIKLKVEW